jgi:hypothetical protein
LIFYDILWYCGSNSTVTCSRLLFQELYEIFATPKARNLSQLSKRFERNGR